MQYSAVHVTLVAVLTSSALAISPFPFPGTATTVETVSSASLASPQTAPVLLPPSTRARPIRTRPSSPSAIATELIPSPAHPVIYATNDEGAQPVSGAVIIDTDRSILFPLQQLDRGTYDEVVESRHRFPFLSIE
ncbi:hypothetical protein NUW54_g11348 [Trametes sanguinea]|uniref:Uncharacterized protein n=1 Tax=Trametes sanguinea TaxID=158606 RepID=A0ACC1NHU4_9APHY|nr:hypothetical protein NUW54_g11348 [Trametes sanguinea]